MEKLQSRHRCRQDFESKSGTEANQPRSGEKLQPTAQAVSRVMRFSSPGGAKESSK
jgi:hypothetical protein